MSGKSTIQIHVKKGQGVSPQHLCYIIRHLSAIVNCWASKLILLKLFHIASVSGDISRVSRNATALQQNKTNINIADNQLLHLFTMMLPNVMFI